MKKLSRVQAGSERGFTLVELMISLVLGLLIILALLTMLINVNRNNSELSSTNRLIENGRFAVQLLATDISHAGYWSGHVPQFDDLTGSTTVGPADVPTAVPDPCLTFASWDAAHKNNLVGIAVQGSNILDAASPTSPICSTVVANPQRNTDVLVVRHAEPCLVGSSTDDCSDTRLNASPHVYLQASRCATDAVPLVLNTTGFTLKAGNCLADAPIRRFSSSIYYVRDHASSITDGIPTLMRSRYGVVGTNPPDFLAAQALVEGVQGFRVEYGLDNRSDTGLTVNLAALSAAIAWPAGATVLSSPQNRGDGLPDTYVNCTQATPCTADQLVNATVVKIYVLVRAERPTPGYTDTKQYCLAGSCSVSTDYMGPFNDGYKRHLFTQTVRLTNVATRRETP